MKAPPIIILQLRNRKKVYKIHSGFRFFFFFFVDKYSRFRFLEHFNVNASRVMINLLTKFYITKVNPYYNNTQLESLLCEDMRGMNT